MSIVGEIDIKNRTYYFFNDISHCLTLVQTDKSKDALKTYEKLWNRMKNIIRSTSNNSSNYDAIHMNIRFDLDDDFPLKKDTKIT